MGGELVLRFSTNVLSHLFLPTCGTVCHHPLKLAMVLLWPMKCNQKYPERAYIPPPKKCHLIDPVRQGMFSSAFPGEESLC